MILFSILFIYHALLVNSQDCRVIFVTSTTLDADFGALENADSFCSARATDSTSILVKSDIWRAWISNDTIDAKGLFYFQSLNKGFFFRIVSNSFLFTKMFFYYYC
jgi:hypothetical protein